MTIVTIESSVGNWSKSGSEEVGGIFGDTGCCTTVDVGFCDGATVKTRCLVLRMGCLDLVVGEEVGVALGMVYVLALCEREKMHNNATILTIIIFFFMFLHRYIGFY